MNHNKLKIRIYSSGSTVLSCPELKYATNIQYDTLYPGGLFGTAEFFIPSKKITSPLTLGFGMRIKILNGFSTCVWEGLITSIEYVAEADSRGFSIGCTGYWGAVMMARKLRKPWCDMRTDEDTWRYLTTASQAARCDVDRNNRIRFQPKNEAWGIGSAAVIYTAPTGQTCKRISFNYDFKEGGQNWGGYLNTAAGVTLEWSVTADGTGTQDITFATPSADIRLYMKSNASPQTPTDSDNCYFEVSNVKVFTETGAIDAREIAVDVVGYLSDLSTYTGLIDTSLTYALEPYVADAATYADIIAEVASFGTPAGGAIGYGVRESDLSTDDKPVLFMEPIPELTGYDYAIRLDEPNIVPALTFKQDVLEARNWVAFKYTDESNFTHFVTPDDDATLKDTTSIANNHLELHEWIEPDTTSATTAKAMALRFLAQRKDPQWVASGGITVTDYIRDANGNEVAAAEIRAGLRVRVEDFIDDLSGTGLTLQISQTEYNDTDHTNKLTVGVADGLAVQTARMEKA